MSNEHVSVAYPVWAQEILANPKATKEEIERAHASRIETPDPKHAPEAAPMAERPRKLEMRSGSIVQCVEEIPNGLRWVTVLTKEQVEDAIMRAETARASGAPTADYEQMARLDEARRASHESDCLMRNFDGSLTGLECSCRRGKRIAELLAAGSPAGEGSKPNVL